VNTWSAVEIASIDNPQTEYTNEQMAKRNSVAGYLRPCRFTRREQAFTNSLSADAWSFAQLEPGVVGVTRNTEAFIDQLEPVAVQRSFEFKLQFDGRPPVLWQTTGRSVKAGSERMKLYERIACDRGLHLRFVSHDDIYADPIRYQNRLRSQVMLAAWDTSTGEQLDSAVRAQLVRDYRSVEELSKATLADWRSTVVACLRLWGRGLLLADPATYVGPKWLVRAR
jgi:hypothetical protein